MKDYKPEDTVTFVSILDEDWTGRYDGKDYLVPARSKTPFRLVVAQHFAKHMADWVLQRQYDAESAKSKEPKVREERRNRAKLWMDPERFNLYKLMIPELSEEAGIVEEAAKVELKRRPEPKIGQ